MNVHDSGHVRLAHCISGLDLMAILRRTFGFIFNGLSFLGKSEALFLSRCDSVLLVNMNVIAYEMHFESICCNIFHVFWIPYLESPGE